MVNFIGKWYNRLSLDKAIIYTVIGYIISAATMPISSWLILTHFNKDEQGYYYTFLSVLTLQVFFELGINQCIVQFASHEFAHLKLNNRSDLGGADLHRSRFASIARFAIYLYLIICILSFIGIGSIGYLFFKSNDTGLVSWHGAWWGLCAASSLNLLITAFTALLEGSGNVGWVAQIRVAANSMRILLLSGSIILGFKLFSPAFSTLGAVVCLALLIFFKWRSFFSKIWAEPHVYGALSWKNEIWPYQWRIAVSFISGYFIFCLFNPILFKYQGAQIAGQFGFTWALLGSVATIANAWSSTKMPRYGMLISLGQRSELDRLWFKSSLMSFIINTTGGAAVILLSVVVKSYYPRYAERMLGANIVSILVVAALFTNVVNSFAYYLRAHKKEPYLYLSIVTAILMLPAAYFLGRYMSARALVSGYVCITIIMFPYAYFIFRSFRRKMSITPVSRGL